MLRSHCTKIAPAFLTGVCLLLSGCKTTQSIERVARTVLNTVPETRRFIKDFDYYAKIARTIRKHHDSATMAEKDVLVILRKTGVLRSPRPKGYPSAPQPSDSNPPPVAVYSGRYRWPLDAGVVSSEFGTRWGKRHQGIDIAADLGEPVRASADGEVIYAGNGLRGYGNAVIVRHDAKTTTLYAHNSALKVADGEPVHVGQVIALLGSTGHSTGPHVHFEIRDGSKPINPRRQLPKSRF